MKEELLEALRTYYGLENAGLVFLRDGGGSTYIVTGAKKYLLKVIGSAFRDTAERSAAVMRYLEANGFPVPKTLLNISGGAVTEVSAGGAERQMIVQEFIEGEEPDLEKSAEAVGELAGNLHSLTEQCPFEPAVRDKHFFIGRYLDLLREKAYPRLPEYEELGERLWEKVGAQPKGICHGDFHRGNLLKTADGTIYVTDFDTVCRAPVMFDVMTMCDMTNYFDLKQKDIGITEKVYGGFLKGYSRFRKLSKEEILSFPYWVAVRHFQLQATILEIHGKDCIDERFIDYQLYWLDKWLREASDHRCQ